MSSKKLPKPLTIGQCIDRLDAIDRDEAGAVHDAIAKAERSVREKFSKRREETLARSADRAAVERMRGA